MHLTTCTVKWVFEHHYHVIVHFYGDWTKNLCKTSGLGRSCNQCIQACLTKGPGPSTQLYDPGYMVNVGEKISLHSHNSSEITRKRFSEKPIVAFTNRA